MDKAFNLVTLCELLKCCFYLVALSTFVFIGFALSSAADSFRRWVDLQERSQRGIKNAETPKS